MSKELLKIFYIFLINFLNFYLPNVRTKAKKAEELQKTRNRISLKKPQITINKTKQNQKTPTNKKATKTPNKKSTN